MQLFIKSHLLRSLPIAFLLFGLSIFLPADSSVSAHKLDLEHKMVPEFRVKDSSLKLIGTAVTDAPDQGIAVIEDPQNRVQWLLREGDHAGNIHIKEIRYDHIVINSGNGDEKVNIRSFLVGYERAPVHHVQGPSVIDINRVPSRDRQVLLDRTAAEAALADPESVLNEVTIVPARYFNRNVGFRITNFDKGSIFAEMGLRSGDLVLAVNDREIAGPTEAESFLETVRQGGDLDLTVRRRARTLHINLLIQ